MSFPHPSPGHPATPLPRPPPAPVSVHPPRLRLMPQPQHFVRHRFGPISDATDPDLEALPRPRMRVIDFRNRNHVVDGASGEPCTVIAPAGPSASSRIRVRSAYPCSSPSPARSLPADIILLVRQSGTRGIPDPADTVAGAGFGVLGAVGIRSAHPATGFGFQGTAPPPPSGTTAGGRPRIAPSGPPVMAIRGGAG